MRIDSVVNSAVAAQLLLERAKRDLPDLHLVAYSREAAKDAERVSGGAADFALDTHGSQAARVLLKEGMRLTDGHAAHYASWGHRVATFFADGELSSRRRPYTLSATEFINALEAQYRRDGRGEGTNRNYPQPGGLLLAENRRLTKENEQLKRELADKGGSKRKTA